MDEKEKFAYKWFVQGYNNAMSYIATQEIEGFVSYPLTDDMEKAFRSRYLDILMMNLDKKGLLDKHLKCLECNTLLIENKTFLVKDYCPKCKDAIVYVIDTETGKGKQIFFKELIRRSNENR